MCTAPAQSAVPAFLFLSQVIWLMMAHLARFTVFLLVVMASFAVAFQTLFFTCIGLEPTLDEAYGTFWRSLLTMFESMLGNFDFDTLSSAGMCHRPSWAYNAGVLLLMGYLVIMSILLLNLLIAVMSTVRSPVVISPQDDRPDSHFCLSSCLRAHWWRSPSTIKIA